MFDVCEGLTHLSCYPTPTVLLPHAAGRHKVHIIIPLACVYIYPYSNESLYNHKGLHGSHMCCMG